MAGSWHNAIGSYIKRSTVKRIDRCIELMLLYVGDLKQAQFVAAMDGNYASTTLSIMGCHKVASTMPVQQDTYKAHLQQYEIMKITRNN